MSQERIVIVEDEKIIALDLQRRLERFGYSVVAMAQDGHEAVALTKLHTPDLVLMDIMLSGDIDGIDAAVEIKQSTGTPLIFITAYADEKTLERAKAAEPSGYILKPFKERELYSTIDIALYKSAVDIKLKRQERLFSAILHSISDGIISTDAAFTINFMNSAAESILGVKELLAQKKPIESYFKILDVKGNTINLEELTKSAEAWPIHFADASIITHDRRTLIVEGNINHLHEKDSSQSGFLIVLTDITEYKRMSAKVDYQASHDILTGLTNREEFAYKLADLLRVLRLQAGEHTLLSMDVDRFKVINDTAGSQAGDELLRQIAVILQSLTSKNDICARLGGDEFALILMNCTTDNAVNVAKRLQEAIAERKFFWQEKSFPLTLSIGIVHLSEDLIDVHSVLAAADDACYMAKEEGGNRINVFRAKEERFQQRRGEMEWISKINSAISQDRFALYFQPIMPLDISGTVRKKLEVLIRLINEDGTVARPGDFIPAAERYNLMPALDRWVVKNSFRIYRELKDCKHELGSQLFSINLSGPSILDDTLGPFILDNLKEYDLNPKDFCFEITETSAISNLSYACRFMTELKESGFTFSLDDFGSGFSSFGYLKNLPVDYLKIDGSFVQNMDENAVSYTMVDSINSMGHVLGLKTIAEFVRNPVILTKVREIGVDYAQGYEIAEPKPFPKG